VCVCVCVRVCVCVCAEGLEQHHRVLSQRPRNDHVRVMRPVRVDVLDRLPPQSVRSRRLSDCTKNSLRPFPAPSPSRPPSPARAHKPSALRPRDPPLSGNQGSRKAREARNARQAREQGIKRARTEEKESNDARRLNKEAQGAGRHLLHAVDHLHGERRVAVLDLREALNEERRAFNEERRASND